VLACARLGDERRPPRRSAAGNQGCPGKTVQIGVIADVTGGGRVYGTMQKNAYDLANDDIKSGIIDAGGANLTFDVQDAASDGAQVVNLMQKFTTDGSTPLVLGPTLSGEAFKAFPIAKRANFPGDGHVDDRRRRHRDRSDGLSATRWPNRK
jgi:ABC-type branched-subunit amino acid transport system substrate-binding protein